MEAAAEVHFASLVTGKLYLRMDDMFDSAYKPILQCGVNWPERVALASVAHIVGVGGSCRGI